MIDLDTWQEVFSTLQKNALRTVMTAWGVFWGTFMLVLMLGIGSGLEGGVIRNMASLSANNVFLWGDRVSKPYGGLSPGRRIWLDLDDVAALRQVPGVVAVAPSIELGGWRQGNNVAYGDQVGNFGVRGETPDYLKVAIERPHLGRFINETDMQELRKVAVIGQAVRYQLMPDDVNPIGQYLKIRGLFFQVVGVISSVQGGDDGERTDNSVIIPFSTFQSAFNFKSRVGASSVRIEQGADAAELELTLRGLLAERHGLDPTDRQAIGAFNLSKQNQRVVNLFQGVRAFVWFVCVCTLFAGALGVSNIMLISVKERTREFGVRKALGATPGSVVRMVLQEASVLTALAGYLGLFAGVVGLELMARYATSRDGPLAAPSIELSAALVAILVLVIAGLLAGIAPARHAARIRPVVALRSE